MARASGWCPAAPGLSSSQCSFQIAVVSGGDTWRRRALNGNARGHHQPSCAMWTCRRLTVAAPQGLRPPRTQPPTDQRRSGGDPNGIRRGTRADRWHGMVTVVVRHRAISSRGTPLRREGFGISPWPTQHQRV
jgi:hypothetical protein